MIIQKVFSDLEEEEVLYSVLLDEEELFLFSESAKEVWEREKAEEIERNILRDYFYKSGTETIEVDMHEFLTRFYEAHQPIKEHFTFLCDECHKIYDKEEIINRRPKGSNLFCGYGKPKD